MSNVTSVKTVLDFFSADTKEQAKRHAYKYTDCGMWLQFERGGIELGSIVEGADFGTATYKLRYANKFTSKDIQDRIDAIEAEADAIWKWANEPMGAGGASAADVGIDAPDIAYDYSHLNPSGRSC